MTAATFGVGLVGNHSPWRTFFLGKIRGTCLLSLSVRQRLHIQDGLDRKLGRIFTAFDVAKPSVASKVRSLTGVRRTRGGGSSKSAGRARTGLFRKL